MARRPIAEYFALEPHPDVIVGDDAGNAAEAGWSEDDGWVDLARRDIPRELGFEPTWFVEIPSREVEPDWLRIDDAPDGFEVLVTNGMVVAMAKRDQDGWYHSSGGRMMWEGDAETGGAAYLDFEPTGWKPKPLP